MPDYRNTRVRFSAPAVDDEYSDDDLEIALEGTRDESLNTTQNDGSVASVLCVKRLKEQLKHQPDESLPLPEEYVGVEVELEYFTADFMEACGNWWRASRDGSLREGGVEFVFKEPMYGKDIKDAITHLWKFITPDNCTARAGVHVHINVTDMSMPDLAKMAGLYALFEKPIFRWIGNDRENSNFCVPWYRAGNHLEQYIDALAAVVEEQQSKGNSSARPYIALRNILGRMPRYSALNLASLPRYGSLEFRHMQTPADMQRVVDWVAIVQGFKAATISALEPSVWLRSFSELRADGFLEEYFNPKVRDLLLSSYMEDGEVNRAELDSDTWGTLPLVHRLLLTTQPQLKQATTVPWTEFLQASRNKEPAIRMFQRQFNQHTGG